MAKNVLLVYPGKYRAILPELPLPLLYISSALKDIEYSPRILDLRLQKYKGVLLDNVLCVGISAMTGSMITYGLEFAKYVRSVNPELPIIWGGIHPTLLPEQTIKNEYVDIVVRGEGERTIQELVQALEERRPLDTVDGITYKYKGEIKNKPDREFIDMNSIKIELPYELLNLKKYELGYFPIHTSRGCPSKCSFCYNLAFNKCSWRCKSSEKVLDEIEYVVKNFQTKKISLVSEDNFFVSKKRVEEICQGIIDRNMGIKWVGFCRLDYFSKFGDPFITLLERSGCEIISFGAESGEQRLLDLMNKELKIDQTIRASKKIAGHNITQMVSFMCGFPTETMDDLKKTLDLIDTLLQVNPKMQIVGILPYTPYPGTPLYSYIIEKYVYVSPKSLEEWGNFGPYRNVGNTWHDTDYIKLLKMLSILSRFPFYSDSYELSERFRRFPLKQGYKLFAYLARKRWKHRFFKYPIEWIVAEKVLERLRGFV